MAETKQTVVEEQIIGKITMSQIRTNPVLVKAMEGDNAELALARIYGSLDDVREQFDKDKGQTYTYFAGTFEALNMQDGEVYKSGKLFLPKGISELVEKSVNDVKKALMDNAIKGGATREEAEKVGTRGVSLDFAFEVRSIKAKNPAGYSYKVYPLISPEQSDRLKAMRDKVLNAGTVSSKTLTAGQRGSGPVTLEGNAKKSA